MNNFDLETYFNDMLMNNNSNYNNGNNNVEPNNQTDISMNNSIPLYGPYEGFIKGNLFANTYMPYKNYTPAKLTPRNEYEEDLLNLNQMQFAYHELNLLLDNYPDDEEVLKIFNSYRQRFNDLLQNFEAKYGPVTVLSEYLNKNPWSWDNEPWPWEGDAN